MTATTLRMLRQSALLVCLALAASAGVAPSAFGQARDFHTQRVVLDDGNGNTTTIQTTGASNGTFTIPSNTPSTGDVITSTSAGGTTWQAPGGLPSGTVIMHTSSTPPSGYTLLSGPSLISGASAWVSETAVPTYRNTPMVGAINGKIYVVGGYAQSLAVLSSMDVYDAASNSWSTDVTTGTFTGRADGTAAVVGGKLYAIAGNKNPGYSADNEVYDPVAKTWTTKASVPGGGRYHPVALVSGNYIYLIGGGNGSNLLNNDVYDVANNTWNITKTGTSLTSGMSNAGGAAVGGKFYLLASSSPDFRSYNPSTDAWSTASVLNFTTRQSATLAAANGKIYAVGGIVSAGPPFFGSLLVSTTETFDPATSSWSAGISTGLTPQFGGVAAVTNNTIYLLNGKTFGGPTDGLLNQSFGTGTSVYYYVKN